MEKDSNPLISILIPVYNVHKFLKDSLTSVKNQTYSNLEIICIDDGSTDGSFEILKHFSQEDPRFKVFTQENKGIGYTRNALLSKIQGEYFAFVDSDDQIVENYIEKLYSVAKTMHADVVRCGHWESRNGEKKDCNPDRRKGPVADQTVKKLLAGYHDSIVWGKLIKTSLLQNIQIRFCETGVSEDLSFIMLLFALTPSIVTIPDLLYIYQRDNVNAITSRQNRGNVFLGRLKNIIYVCEELKKREKIDKPTANLLTKLLLHHLSSLRKLPTERQQQETAVFNKSIEILKQLRQDNARHKRFIYTIIIFLLTHTHGKITFYFSKLFIVCF